MTATTEPVRRRRAAASVVASTSEDVFGEGSVEVPVESSLDVSEHFARPVKRTAKPRVAKSGSNANEASPARGKDEKEGRAPRRATSRRSSKTAATTASSDIDRPTQSALAAAAVDSSIITPPAKRGAQKRVSRESVAPERASRRKVLAEKAEQEDVSEDVLPAAQRTTKSRSRSKAGSATLADLGADLEGHRQPRRVVPPRLSAPSPLDAILPALLGSLSTLSKPRVKGRVIEVVGTIVKAVVPHVRLGELCLLRNAEDDQGVEAEVVGFSNEAALLTPIGDMQGISSSTQVWPTGRSHQVAVGPGLLGRVLDGLGRPLDIEERGPLVWERMYPVYADAPDPLARRIISQPLELGIRALDSVLTCGEGQRMGVFAAAGGGKSTLMGMLVNGADVDVTVIALIGERGREVREFLEHELGEEGRRKSVVVCATSDRSSMERAKAAYVATAIAEYFRDQGKKVLFLMDSVTRFARALREIGLAAGEPPTRRGFPPSVFATLPKLLERTGMSEHGSITALYTVLVEGDDMTEPIADETRSIIDGHIVLSRKLGAANHYPAIDVLASVSRVMNAVVSLAHQAQAGRLRMLMAKYEEMELLVKVGEYKPGADALADEAIAKIDGIRQFLRQKTTEQCSMAETLQRLERLVGSS
jgi:type III secretion protein N (ATPase)